MPSSFYKNNVMNMEKGSVSCPYRDLLCLFLHAIRKVVHTFQALRLALRPPGSIKVVLENDILHGGWVKRRYRYFRQFATGFLILFRQIGNKPFGYNKEMSDTLYSIFIRYV